MKITLVTSPFFDHAAYYSEAGPAAQAYLPLGLLALAAHLRQSGHEVNIADLNDAYNRRVWWDGDRFYETGAEFLESFSPDVLGFLTAYDSYHHVLNIAAEFKARNPNVPIVLGGYQASVVAEETIKHFPCIDAVVRGEGEESFLKVIQCYEQSRDLDGVLGVTFRKGGEPLRNAEQPLIRDLDELPTPAYDLYPVDPRRFVYLEVGRGCPFQCTYCSTSPFWRRATRYKSPSRVIQEMALLRDSYAVTQFHFVHDLFTVNNNWVRDFCYAAKAGGLNARWTCSGSINTVDEDLIAEMAGAGCAGIYFGVETGSKEVGEIIKKRLDLAHAERVIRRALELGVAPVTGFIAGFPFETEKTLQDTLRTFFNYKRLGVPLAHIFVAIPEKGSPLHREYRQELSPTRHFLDFPVSPKLAERNFQLIESHAELFCGMYRFNNPHFEPDFFRGIDEFSPLVNTVPVPVNTAVDKLNDPVLFYRGWLAWISERNEGRERAAFNQFYGSTQDMLDYIRHLQATGSIRIPYLDSVLTYEAVKNEFRKHVAEIEENLGGQTSEGLTDGAQNDSAQMMECRPVQSPYNRIIKLDWDIQPLYSTLAGGEADIVERPTFILFYVSLRQRAGIGDFFKDVMLDISAVKIDPATKAILEMSDGQTSVGDMSRAIAIFARDLGMQELVATEMVVSRVEKLRSIGALSLAEGYGEVSANVPTRNNLSAADIR